MIASIPRLAADVAVSTDTWLGAFPSVKDVLDAISFPDHPWRPLPPSWFHLERYDKTVGRPMLRGQAHDTHITSRLWRR